MNVQEITQLVLNADIRLLAGLAMVLLILLFWRLFYRISRVDKELSRINERFERIREEVRSMGRRPLVATIPTSDQASNIDPISEAAPTGETVKKAEPAEEQPLEESFSFTTDSYRDESFETFQPQAPTEETEDSPFDPFETESFSFDKEPAAEGTAALFDEDEEAAEEKPFWDEPENAGIAEEQMDQEQATVFPVEEAPVEEKLVEETPVAAEEASVEEAPVEEKTAEEEPEPVAKPAAEDVDIVKLEDDPARPEVCLARCMVCNYKLAYPVKLAGRRVRCPSCKSAHVLP